MMRRPTDSYDDVRTMLAFERRCIQLLIEEALRANKATPAATAALEELAGAVHQRSVAIGRDYKGGQIGGQYDRHAAARGLGCSCCPHSECICEEGCEERCAYHAPLIVSGLRAQLREVGAHLRSLLKAAGLAIGDVLTAAGEEAGHG
jgi:hypothetical protein